MRKIAWLGRGCMIGCCFWWVYFNNLRELNVTHVFDQFIAMFGPTVSLYLNGETFRQLCNRLLFNKSLKSNKNYIEVRMHILYWGMEPGFGLLVNHLQISKKLISNYFNLLMKDEKELVCWIIYLATCFDISLNPFFKL